MATPERVPHRNRVTPHGEIVAIPLRGTWCGNRGIIHRGTDIVRFHASALWITCALTFKDWQLPQWEPHHFTLLFFHDEAVSLAAGHRPCALCRRPTYAAFQQASAAGTGTDRLSAHDLDLQLHSERIVRGTHRRRLHDVRWRDLPSGAFAMHDDRPCLVLADRLVPWTTEGYAAPAVRPRRGVAQALTPPTTLAALRAGYRPQIDRFALT